MSGISLIEEDSLELLEFKVKCAPSSYKTTNEGVAARNFSAPCQVQSHPDPDFPNNWKESQQNKNTYDTPDVTADEQKLNPYQEQKTEGVTLYHNLQALHYGGSERSDRDFQSEVIEHSAFSKPIPSSSNCCGNKMVILILCILVAVSLLSSFAALTLAIDLYTLNRSDGFDQLEIRFQQMQDAVTSDGELLINNTLTEIFKINATTGSLASHISHLQTILQSQTSTSDNLIGLVSKFGTELHLSNKTQTGILLQLHSLNTSMTSMEDIATSLSSSLHSMQEKVQSKLSFLDIELNSTKNVTVLLLEKLTSVKSDIISKLFSLETHSNVTNNALEILQSQIEALQTEIAEDKDSHDTRLNTTQVTVGLVTSQVSHLLDALDITKAQIISVTNTISSLSRNQASTRHALNATNDNFISLQTKFGQVLSVSRLLNNTLTSPLNLYGACYRDKVNCTVLQHQVTPYWYRCTTAALRINTPVSNLRMGWVYHMHGCIVYTSQSVTAFHTVHTSALHVHVNI